MRSNTSHTSILKKLNERLRGRFNRRGARFILAGAILSGGIVAAGNLGDSVEAAATKITICHRTHSTTNPYRRITVAQAAITKNNGHGDEGASNTHNKGTGVFDPSFSYPPNAKLWNDIIPDETAGGSAAITMNYSGRGAAIYDGTVFDGTDYAGLCGKLSAKEFYDLEVAAGVDPADALADLDEQAANEDEALKRALGGSFVGSDPTTYASLVNVDTTAASGVGATSATLNGTLTVGPTSTDTYFHWGTSETLASYTTTAATPTPVTETAPVSLALTELSPCTTYYYRVVGVTDPGAATEAELLGDIVSFTTSCATTTTVAETTTTVAETTTTVAETTTTVAETTTTVAETTTTTVAETTTTVAETTTTAASTTVAPSTTAASTTVAPSTTAASTTVAPSTTTDDGFTARVEGVVWLDMNRNAVQDKNEPGLPGIPVRLEPNGSSTSAGVGGPGQARRLGYLQAVSTLTTTTDAFGAYSFPKVAPGTWTLVATLTSEQLQQTSDTGGINDWIVPVAVPINGVGVGDFAAAGSKSLTGLLETATGETRVVGPVHDALHAAVAGDEFEPGHEQVPVVAAGVRVHQVHPGDVALATPRRLHPAHAAHMQGLRRPALPHEFAHQRVEPGAVAADADEIGRSQVRREQLHLHLAAGVDDLGMRLDADEPVGRTERGDRPGALAHRIGHPAFRALDEAHQQVLGTPALGVDPHRHARAHRRATLRSQPGEGAQHRRDELMEGEDGGGGESRQDGHRPPLRDREAHRLAGLERHAVRNDTRLAQARDDPIGEIPRALGRSTRQHHRVLAQRALERLRERGIVIAHDPQRDRFAAQLLDRGRQDGGVGVVDRARRQRVSGRHDLVAGGEDRHPRAPPHRDLGEAERGEHADLARAEHLPGAQHRLATRDVGARMAEVLARRDRPRHPQAGRRVDLRVLDHHDRVGATRQHAAGGDRGGRPGHDRHLRRDAGREPLAGEGERAHVLLGRAMGVLRPQREAVHVGAVEARHIDRRDYGGREHPAERPRERDPLLAQRGEAQVALEARGGLLAADHGEELLLLHAVGQARGEGHGHRIGLPAHAYRYTVTRAPGP